ncbi:hypothetical protein PsYK624_129360 [Phanerochaete sordida]|uniref:Uncharacterized protein n=1 Tax=Phanerochaete sordida TaxID=48140 RepID=A0A9P3LIV2_9APHY|nr:hypothetical protein PsYK624_129360 [Phanerochaete sordida]
MTDDQEGVFTWDASAIDEARDTTFGRVVVPVPLLHKPLKKNILDLEYREHGFIGDAILLSLSDGQTLPAVDHQFVLPSGLRATYGQINGLAGDFYGTDAPISDGRDPRERMVRFDAAFRTLSDPGPRQPAEAQSILGILQTEVDAVNAALHKGEDPSAAYSSLPDVSAQLEALTVGRPAGAPGYLGLARINWDHFGDDARKAYNTGHTAALQVAAAGDLERAYAWNAFADHFLVAAFSAGHLRTPRRLLHRTQDVSADACAKLMHDEDGALGLAVADPLGAQWTAYGRARALDAPAADNLRRCVAAVQRSADEVYAAHKTARTVPPADFRAWLGAPTLASARAATQALAPLVTAAGARRADVTARRVWAFTADWWFWSTYVRCTQSGLWTAPIAIDGVASQDGRTPVAAPRPQGGGAVASPGAPSVVPSHSVAVTFPRLWTAHVYHQNAEGQVLESVHRDGAWSGGAGRQAAHASRGGELGRRSGDPRVLHQQPAEAERILLYLSVRPLVPRRAGRREHHTLQGQLHRSCRGR